MISSLNIILFILFSLGSILILRYFFRLRDQGHILEILEIKVKAVQRKTSEEKLELSELKKRLEEQKNPLEKKWEEIQAGEKILENRAVKLQHDRELLEKQKHEMDQSRIKLEESQRRIEAVNQHLKIKWERERQDIEIKKNELRDIIRQLNLEKANLDIQQTQIKKEQQYLIDEKRKILKKTNEYEILKIYFETQRKEAFAEKSKLQKEGGRILEEKKKLEKEKEENQFAKMEINNEIELLNNQQIDLAAKEKLLENQREKLEQNIKEIEQAKHEFEKLLKRITVSTLHQIKKAREQASNNTQPNMETFQKQPDMPLIDVAAKQGDIILETLCWKINQKWHFGLTIISGCHEEGSYQFFQENEILSKNECGDNVWMLNSFSPVKIHWQSRDEFFEQRFNISLDDFKSPLLFKLQKPDCGRLVKYPSTGNYLIVVPADWQSGEIFSCEGGREAELCSITGCKAYQFNFSENNNSVIIFRKPDEKALCIAQQKIRFCLSEANCIEKNGANEFLFGEKLPRVIDREDSWQEIGTIIVGDRDRNFRKIQKSPFPLISATELDLNLIENVREATINKTTDHNLIIDIYDKFHILLESICFEYIDSLEKIAISEYPILPGLSGHSAVEIYFIHDKYCQIKSLSNDVTNIKIKSDEKRTIAQVFPAPLADVTNWLIQDRQGREITIKIGLNRIWWQLISGSEFPQKIGAQDSPLKLSSKNIQAIAEEGIYIWTPALIEKKHILIGFYKESAKSFVQNADEFGIFIPFKELFNANTMIEFENKLQLKMWLDEKSNEFAILLDLTPDQYACNAKNCNFKAHSKNELNAHIKETHLVNLFEDVNYQNFRLKFDLELPVEIYQCSYCNCYIFSDTKTDNPVTSIINHIKQCPSVNSMNGSSFYSFRIINNMKEVKKSVFPELPVVSKCLLCDQYFKNTSEKELLSHFTQFHEKDLIIENQKIASR